MFRILDKISYFIGKILSWLSAASLAAMAILIVMDVFLRKIASKGVYGSYDYVSILLSMTVLFAMVYAQQQRGTVHVTFLIGSKRLPDRVRHIIWAIGLLLADVMAFIFTYGCRYMWKLLQMIGTKFSTAGIPYWYLHMIATICFALFTIVLTIDVMKAFAAIFIPKYAEDVDKNFVS